VDKISSNSMKLIFISGVRLIYLHILGYILEYSYETRVLKSMYNISRLSFMIRFHYILRLQMKYYQIK
jgi:L-asparagine transporter-like permease